MNIDGVATVVLKKTVQRMGVLGIVRQAGIGQMRVIEGGMG